YAPSPLMAVAPAAGTSPVPTLAPPDAKTLNAVLREAERRWLASGLLRAHAISALGTIQLQIADLQDLTLGLVDEVRHTIVLDVNGAGYGWFIDPTLRHGEEFGRRVSADTKVATLDSAAYGRIDLLTVV